MCKHASEGAPAGRSEHMIHGISQGLPTLCFPRRHPRYRLLLPPLQQDHGDAAAGVQEDEERRITNNTYPVSPASGALRHRYRQPRDAVAAARASSFRFHRHKRGNCRRYGLRGGRRAGRRTPTTA